MELDAIVVPQLVTGSGGKIVVLCETRWTGLTTNDWGRETDLGRFWSAILPYSTGRPNKRGSTGKRRYQDMRRNTAARELHRDRGARFVAK